MNNRENRQWYGLNDEGDIVPIELAETDEPKKLEDNTAEPETTGQTGKDLLG